MSKKFIILLSLFLFAFSSLSYSEHTINPDKIFSEVNGYRIKHGLPPLKLDPVISREAYLHSKDMANHKIDFGHSGFKLRAQTLSREFSHFRGISENVAFTEKNEAAMVHLWLESSPHRKNIEGRYNLTGIGLARDKTGRLYGTQIFVLQ